MALKKENIEGLKAAGGNVFLANSRMKSYVKSITLASIPPALADIDFGNANHIKLDLPNHLRLAQKNANYYNDTLTIRMNSALMGVVETAEKFDSRYKRLKTMAENFDDNKENIVNGLRGVKKKIDKSKENCDAVKNELDSFRKLLNTDHTNFKTDDELIQSQLYKEGGIIDQLKDKKDAYESAIHKDQAMIVGGAGMEVLGGLMIVGGIVGEIFSAGATTAMVVAGGALIAGGAVMQGFAGHDWAVKAGELADTMAELREDEHVQAQMTNIADFAEKLMAEIENAVDAVNSLSSGFVRLSGDIENTIKALDAAEEGALDDDDWFTADLDAAHMAYMGDPSKDVKGALQHAQALQDLDAKIEASVLKSEDLKKAA